MLLPTEQLAMLVWGNLLVLVEFCEALSIEDPDYGAPYYLRMRPIGPKSSAKP